MFAVDVSVWNGWNNDFKAAKNSGVDAVIIRCNYGYSDYGFQKRGYDETFETNFKKARDAGLLIGVYTAAYSRTIEQAREEARRCLKVLNGRNLELPIFIDAEFEEFASGDNVTDKINAYMQVIKDAGYKYGVYANLNWFTNYINKSRLLAGCDKWIAHYNSNLYNSNPEYYDGDYEIWQYGSEGYRVNGIGQASGGVDVNIIYKNYSKYKEGWQGNSTGWWYQNGDGTYPKKSWKKINDEWYYFNKNGYAYQNKWLLYNNKWYYFDNSCKMVANGWKQLSDKWYYFDKWGGAIQNNWLKYKDEWYYFDENCYMVQDKFITLGNETFYLNNWGVCELNYVREIDGKMYAFDDRGVLIKDKVISSSGVIE